MMRRSEYRWRRFKYRWRRPECGWRRRPELWARISCHIIEHNERHEGLEGIGQQAQ